MYFDELNLNDHILDALYDMRFETCTPIQEKCIPEILKGRDVLGVAQTGTGKTAAYLLPILSMLDSGNYPDDAINCVVMSPTRELAQQIDQAFQGFGYYLDGVSSVAVYGGNDGNRYDQELKGMRLGADLIIATPGRFITHISMGNVDLSKVSFFVLDEADRMLDMGFAEDIMLIASKLPKTCQTIMFSATMPEKIEQLANSLLHDPVTIKLAPSKPAEKIKQGVYLCHETQKLQILDDLFKREQLKRVIIFAGSKMKVKQISRALQQLKVNSGEMHSDLEQAERDQMLYRFKSGQIDVLVATDILARGIDIDDIQMVVNYDVPHDEEDYVHRIGRTARADRDGRAVTLVSADDRQRFRLIERFIGRKIERLQLPEGIAQVEQVDEEAPRRKNDRRNHRSKDNRQRRPADGQHEQNKQEGREKQRPKQPKRPRQEHREGEQKQDREPRSPRKERQQRPRHDRNRTDKPSTEQQQAVQQPAANRHNRPQRKKRYDRQPREERQKAQPPTQPKQQPKQESLLSRSLKWLKNIAHKND